MSLVKFEVDCFSLLPFKARNSYGDLKFFHLFSSQEDAERDASEFLIAYGDGSDLFAVEWLRDHNQSNTNNKNNIN